MVDREELKELCANWPVDRMQFESRTGKWKSSIIEITLSPVDRTTVNLSFDLLLTESSWSGSPHRNLILHIAGFSFNRDEQYPGRLNEAVLDFLDSESLSDEKRVLTPAPDGVGESGEFA
jgi:hypothetical protein